VALCPISGQNNKEYILPPKMVIGYTGVHGMGIGEDLLSLFCGILTHNRVGILVTSDLV
jgi:hypothetical protein